MITLKSCPVCDSNQIGPYQTVLGGSLEHELISGIKVDVVIVTSYQTCKNCRLIFQNPRLSDRELNEYYSSGYYRKTINPPPEGMDKGEEIRAQIDTDIIKRYINNPESHLDVGCGLGYLLDKISANVKVGVESDIGYVKAKGVKVYREMNKVSIKSFDLVTSLHVLEHVPHPLVYLKKMVKFVKKGGYLVIEVPSWKTRGGPLGFAHLSHFEPDVLKLMCIQVGLEIVQTEFTPNLLLICKK